jgi:hypothetical protein
MPCRNPCPLPWDGTGTNTGFGLGQAPGIFSPAMLPPFRPGENQAPGAFIGLWIPAGKAIESPAGSPRRAAPAMTMVLAVLDGNALRKRSSSRDRPPSALPLRCPNAPRAEIWQFHHNRQKRRRKAATLLPFSPWRRWWRKRMRAGVQLDQPWPEKNLFRPFVCRARSRLAGFHSFRNRSSDGKYHR